MKYLKVKITKVINEQPDFIVCTFIDANRTKWTIEEKIPVIFSEYIDLTDLPVEGFYVPGTILSVDNDRVLFSTLEPFRICSDEGETQFVVSINQISDKQRT